MTIEEIQKSTEFQTLIYDNRRDTEIDGVSDSNS